MDQENPITESRNCAKSSGFPGMNGFRLEKETLCNVSVNSLEQKKIIVLYENSVFVVNWIFLINSVVHWYQYLENVLCQPCLHVHTATVATSAWCVQKDSMSALGHVVPKHWKMVLVAFLLGTEHYGDRTMGLSIETEVLWVIASYQARKRTRLLY